jgi:serine phosphatase RsbU (regulator of sigma subunit)
MTFGPLDRVLAYSDGITEARVGDGFFGEEGILDALRSHPEGGMPLLEALLARIHDASGGRTQPDDLTVLLAERG